MRLVVRRGGAVPISSQLFQPHGGAVLCGCHRTHARWGQTGNVPPCRHASAHHAGAMSMFLSHRPQPTPGGGGSGVVGWGRAGGGGGGVWCGGGGKCSGAGVVGGGVWCGVWGGGGVVVVVQHLIPQPMMRGRPARLRPACPRNAVEYENCLTIEITQVRKTNDECVCPNSTAIPLLAKKWVARRWYTG